MVDTSTQNNNNDGESELTERMISQDMKLIIRILYNQPMSKCTISECTIRVPCYAPGCQLPYSIAEQLEIGGEYKLYHNEIELYGNLEENDDDAICDLFEPRSKITLVIDRDPSSLVVKEEAVKLKCITCNCYHWECSCEYCYDEQYERIFLCGFCDKLVSFIPNGLPLFH